MSATCDNPVSGSGMLTDVLDRVLADALSGMPDNRRQPLVRLLAVTVLKWLATPEGRRAAAIVRLPEQEEVDLEVVMASANVLRAARKAAAAQADHDLGNELGFDVEDDYRQSRNRAMTARSELMLAAQALARADEAQADHKKED